MGFHQIFIDKIKPLLLKSKRIAVIGDQEVVNDVGHWAPITSLWGKDRACAIDIYEHPAHSQLINTGTYIKIDLSNVSIPKSTRYDLVIDGGTLEHVSNFVGAFSEFWSALEIHGYFVFSYPINNLVDHGYWQPQPRFFWDFFDKNGGQFKHFEVFQHPAEGLTSQSVRRVAYSPKAPETMAQPGYFVPSMTAGLFAIVEKLSDQRIVLPLEEIN